MSGYTPYRITKEEFFAMNDDVEVFVNPSFEDALVGYTVDNAPVYDYEKMVESLIREYEMDPECADPEMDAREWIDYNTIRTAPYMKYPPVFINLFEEAKGDSSGRDEASNPTGQWCGHKNLRTVETL